MPDQIKEKITASLQAAEVQGEQQTDKIRNAVRMAVSEALLRMQEGAGEVRPLAKNTIAAILENAQSEGQEAKDEDIQAAIEGIIEGISHSRRQAIAKTQTEIDQLKAQIDAQENTLQTQVDGALVEIEAASEDTNSRIRDAIASTVNSFKDTEEFALLKKRYAQLQAQLEILQANLKSRYGERFEEIQKHLEEAKNWYEKASTQVEPTTQQHTEFEAKLTKAGKSMAGKERRGKQILKELWHDLTQLFHEK